MTTKQEIMEIAETLGISAVGFTSADSLRDLPTGAVFDVTQHLSVHEALPSTRSAIILAYRIWDPIFNVVAKGPKWVREGVPLEDEGSEFYQLYSQVLDAKAGALALHLQREGHESMVTRRIALKPAAIKAGLGCRGKNTLTVSPEFGSYVRFTAVLTSAEFEPDEPLSMDLCGECTRCIDACPTGALRPHEINIKRCLTYAAENPDSPAVEDDVRDLEMRIIKKPSPNSFIECTICQDACPVGVSSRGSYSQCARIA